ncbi:hypothetical protein [Ancylobacter rudongensis]|uniref:Uncharacterized protein n=1 Tax=Ancylobacter rudongensis TaxID=177413 RepID=A0A1G4TDZ2_9HYPH|nr:hypothetical protein [Ancylobacter rudongensis]SCW79571.1 hypothetical protein SAMN05660859_2872 [Ancylobacter rudongensis]
MQPLMTAFADKADIAHLALLMWALGASALAGLALRELGHAVRRFDDFVREIARFNALFGDDT